MIAKVYIICEKNGCCTTNVDNPIVVEKSCGKYFVTFEFLFNFIHVIKQQVMEKNGKSICRTLKAIRQQIADTNGISYAPEPCTFEGECIGTCPCCEAEVRYIETSLNTLRMAGKVIKIAGISVGMMMLAGCKDGRTPQSLAPQDNIINRTKKQKSVGSKYQVDGMIEANGDTQIVQRFVPSIVAAQVHPLRPQKRTSNSATEQSLSGEKEVDLQAIEVVAVAPVKKIMVCGGIPAISKNSTDNEAIYEKPDKKPSFPGGKRKLKQYIKQNLNNPDTFSDGRHVQGNVVVSFIVESDGSLSQIEVIKGLNDNCDEAAIELVEDMPLWNPGRIDGKTVRTLYHLSIAFK